MEAPRLTGRAPLPAARRRAAGGALGRPGRRAASCSAGRAPGGDWPMMGRDLASTRSQVTERDAAARCCARRGRSTPTRATGEHAQRDHRLPDRRRRLRLRRVEHGTRHGAHRAGCSPLTPTPATSCGRRRCRAACTRSLAVAGGVVYAHVSRGRQAGARRPRPGHRRGAWETVVDTQTGADAVSSPIVYDGLVWVGISGTAAEGDEADRTAFQGSTVLVAAEPSTCPSTTPSTRRPERREHVRSPATIVRKLWTVPQRRVGRRLRGRLAVGHDLDRPRDGLRLRRHRQPVQRRGRARRTPTRC